MLNTVKNFITKHNMIQKGDRIVVGVSGGADSVCLFHVLLKLAPVYDLTLFAVHVNHGIRGEEADEDEAYVKKLCSEHQVSFTAVKADVRALAAKEGLSEEEAGRKVRYEAFYHSFTKNKCNKIAIAHNRNDNAETILFHLFRGSGIKGLTGIPPVRDVIIRPLLNTGRDEIEAYLKENGIGYQTDGTNLTQDYSRNKIRHQIISFAKEEINTAAIEHIVSASNKLAEIDHYLDNKIEAAFFEAVMYLDTKEAYEIDLESLRKEDPVIQKGIVRSIFKQLASQLKDLDSLHVELVLDLMNKQSGKVLNLPYGIIAQRGYHSIILKTVPDQKDREPQADKEAAASLPELKLPVPGVICIPWTNQILHTKLINYKKSMIIPRNGCTKWFDYDKIKNTVLIRTRKEGDFIQINSAVSNADSNAYSNAVRNDYSNADSMAVNTADRNADGIAVNIAGSTAGKRKKLKSLFIDEKIPREKRDLLPLLADGSHIMWVIGGRMSEAYKVDEKTKVILEINLDGGKHDGK